MICLKIRESKESIALRKAKARRWKSFHEAKIIIWSIFTGYVMGVTPSIFDYAQSQRLYGGIGGEIFFPFLPFLLYPAYNVICKMIWEKVNR